MADYVTLGIDALCDRLCERRDTLIIYHVRSDADAIGSAFALREILTAMGMRAWCSCADKIPDRLTFLTDGVQTSVRLGDVPFEYERVISVDSASPAQLGEMYESLGGRVDLMIDHHGLGTRYADGYVDGRAAATGEIIYKIAKKLISRGDLVEIDRRMASCMYAAISSDTGCFRFANTTPDTYRIAADLLELGADSEDINHRLYESKTVEQIRAEGEAANRLKLYCDGRVASVSFPYSSKTALGLKDENLETIIDIPRSIGGVEVAFSVRQPEDKGFFRVSMRSVGDFDVSRVCAEFGGGGHKKAAGCSLEANDIDSAVDAVLEVIIDEINKEIKKMTRVDFEAKLNALKKAHKELITKENKVSTDFYNGVFDRYENCVLTNAHVPLEWRYDLSYEDNPELQERIGVNAVFNSGAVYFDGKYVLVARVEGNDRKSFFAVARSENGIDNFVFDEYPVRLPVYDEPDTNVYDMRVTAHEDGWMYGLFCSERKDKTVNDTSSAVAKCGIVRTKDLVNWERLPDLDTRYQQRNVVLHPEFVDGKYLLYTRPSDGFIDVGSGGGIGCALVDSMECAKIDEEIIIEKRVYHTIKEVKNGAGAPPIKTADGWLHIAHGVRNTAAGLRYVLYCFMTELDDPMKVKYTPGGFFAAPINEERVGDVSNVLFCNGAIEKDGKITFYYASSDTRLHVATTTVEKMVDYCKNTPADGYTTHTSVDAICALIDKNKKLK